MTKTISVVLIAALLALSGVGGASWAQELPPNNNVTMTLEDKDKTKEPQQAPIFKALDNTLFNAGTVKAPGAVTRKFSFKNAGNAPLEIKEVKSGCGCLVSNYEQLIQPGDDSSIDISMTIHPEWDGREISRTTWVLTNDPQNSQIRLTTSATVKADHSEK